MKRHKSLLSLSHDHQHVLSLALKLKYSKMPLSSTPKDELTGLKKELFNKYEGEIRTHFSLEETSLVPLFENNALLGRMLDEHKKLEGLYNKIVSNTENWDLTLQREKLNLLGELLDLHIRFEERELFPMIEETLSEDQLQELGKNLQHCLVLKKVDTF
jgi:hemerythrin-like domain-containing protein